MMDTQVKEIITYMRSQGSITSMDAFRIFGITRLAARISDAKKMGYNIQSVPEVKNGVRYARYYLKEG